MRNGRTFSDGCGTISYKLIRKVWRALPPDRRQHRPTILQIRYRGAKGVLSLDESLPGEQLHVRKSMTKYIANESWQDLELCGAAYKPLSVFLNHQFIKILEDLGVQAKNFKAVQDEAVNTLKRITEHPINAASFLGESSQRTGSRDHHRLWSFECRVEALCKDYTDNCQNTRTLACSPRFQGCSS